MMIAKKWFWQPLHCLCFNPKINNEKKINSMACSSDIGEKQIFPQKQILLTAYLKSNLQGAQPITSYSFTIINWFKIQLFPFKIQCEFIDRFILHSFIDTNNKNHGLQLQEAVNFHLLSIVPVYKLLTNAKPVISACFWYVQRARHGSLKSQCVCVQKINCLQLIFLNWESSKKNRSRFFQF